MEVAEAVNDMKDWEGVVLVDREELDDGYQEDEYMGDMFEWRLTFSPIEGNVEELRVRATSSAPCQEACRAHKFFVVHPIRLLCLWP